MSTYTECVHRNFTRWTDLRDALLAEDEDRYVWRGVANAGWCIETSLDRFARLHGKGDRSLAAAHLLSLYDVYLTETGIAHETSDEKLWGLGQHYGLPTPYLDWTKSPMAAAYFALTSDDPSCARDLRDSCIWRLDSRGPFLRGGDVTIVELGSGIWNLRLRAQRGLFTELKRGECMIDTLKRNTGYIGALEAYVFPSTLIQEASTELASMMIDDLHMFPDHEGVVRHVRALAAK